MQSTHQSANVVTVWPDMVADLFVPVEEALRARGCRVDRYLEMTALREDPGALARADLIYTPGTLSVDRAMLSCASRLRALVSPITGIEGFDLEAANEQSVLVANGQIAENYESMAEATVMLILACLYDLHALEHQLRHQGPWRTALRSRMLKGKTLGLIGFGRIARSIAERLQHWDAKLVAYAPRVRTPLPSHVQRVELDTLLQTSDVICVLASLTAETRHLLDAGRLAMTKRGSCLVNVARGAIIDEQALYSLAATGHFRRLALDTFETEPLAAESPLRTLPDAILTPHAVGHTVETHERMAEVALENITCALRGEAPPYVCNPEILPAWLDRWRRT